MKSKAKSMSAPIIKTKISQPFVRADIVLRPRLLERLHEGLGHPLTLVCAGAGFGKTTLVSAWVNTLESAQSGSVEAPRTAWLSLDERDSTLPSFLRYLVAVIRTAVPQACADTDTLLTSQPEPNHDVLLATFCNDLLLLPQKVVVVLDDYHTIHDTAVHNFLTDLFHHWPQSLHLVLISRKTPALPIARLRAGGDIVEIRNHDLRFQSDEIAEYVQKTWSVPPGPTSLELLERKTEGWITALQLATLSFRNADNVEAMLESLSGTNADIAEYLADEVLARQPRSFHTFLLKASILEHFSMPVCEAIAASEDSTWDARAILDWLVHGNLFVTPLDRRNKWYQFHPLFRDWLRQRLVEKIGPDGVAELHRRAANWYAQHDQMDTAVHHALQAQDLNLAAVLMEQNLCTVLNREDPQTLRRWLQLLPESFIDSRPGLLIIKGWLLSFIWHIDGISSVLQQMEALLDQDEQTAVIVPEHRQLLQGQMAVLQSQEAFHKGQPALSVTYGQKALALLPTSWLYARGGVMSYLALSMQEVGQATAAEEMLQESYGTLLDQTDNYAVRHIFTLALIHLQAGKLEQAEQTGRLLLQQAIQIESLGLQGWAHVILGVVHYQWNQLDIAGTHFEEITGQRYQMNPLIARLGHAGFILVQLAAGRHKEAAELVDALRQFDMKVDGRIDDITQSLAAKVAWATNHMEDAMYWADTFTVPTAPILFIFSELPQLIRVQLLLGRGSTEDQEQAWQVLDNLSAYARQNHNIRRQIEIRATQALALDIQGDTAAARAALKQAVQMAYPGGFIRLFVDLGPRLNKLLTTLAVPAYTEYIQRILAAFPQDALLPAHAPASNGKTISRSAAPPLAESLTLRELQVLNLLREPMSAKEIALRLDISHATVKRHTINLYGKLEVGSRWEAVARAETLGLITPR